MRALLALLLFLGLAKPALTADKTLSPTCPKPPPETLAHVREKSDQALLFVSDFFGKSPACLKENGGTGCTTGSSGPSIAQTSRPVLPPTDCILTS
jgi:hypothetical protein